MSHAKKPPVVAPQPVVLYLPHPNARYGLAVAAQLAGVSRRTLLVYCRAGLVRPAWQPPYGVMEFTEEAIHAARLIAQLRATHALSLAAVKTILVLLEEVERLRAELRFWRHR